MPGNTHTDPALPPKPLLPRVLSATELYDMLMSRIEPELVSGNIERLQESSAHVAPEEKQQRGERYAKAFAEYEVQLQKYQEEWNAKLRTFKRMAIAYIEGKERLHGEASQLTELESSLAA